jgi:hypothetical protein
MREVLSLSTWRLSHWLIFLGSTLYVAMYVGLIPPPHDVMSYLASRPEVLYAFREPHFGRADALILVFSTLFLGPLALVIALVFLVFVMAVLGGFLIPAVRWFGMPEWVANVLTLGVVTTVAYVGRDAWMPKTFWFLGLLARACRIVLA